MTAFRWENLGQDLRYALRGIRARPGFTVAVVLTLALGIGANAAMFSIVDRMLFRPPPMLRAPSLTHRLYFNTWYRAEQYHSSGVPYARYIDFKNDTKSFSQVAMVANRKLAVGVGTATQEMQIAAISASFWAFFDAPPPLGRYFTAQDDTFPVPNNVAVLSYGYWQTAYGGRRDVLGQTVHIAATTYTIIGVAPKGFVALWASNPPAIYIPVSAEGAEMGATLRLRGENWWSTYHWTWATVLAMRKPDVSIGAANADLTAALQRSYAKANDIDHRTARPEDAKDNATVESILADRGPNQSSVSKVATWVAGVAVMVWLIAIANVANLLLARALKRRREIAVRLALGVSRWRLASQLLTESVLLGVFGGVAGVAIAQWGGILLRAQFSPGATAGAVLTDPRTLVFAGVASVLAGLIVGLAPIFQAGRADLTNDLKAGQREGAIHRSKLRVALLVVQGALSVVLLIGAGLFVRSVRNVEHMNLGYNPDPVLNVDWNMRGVKLDSAQQVTLRDRLLAEAGAIPGVVHSAKRLTMPFWSSWNMSLTVPGVDSVERIGSFELNAVSPDYFKTMSTRIVLGRGITEADVNGAPKVMVVSQGMATALWPGQQPIGQCVKIGADSTPCFSVVGVAENIKTGDLTDQKDKQLFYYLSAQQFAPDQGGLFVKVSGDVGTAKETLRKRLQPLMPGAAYVTVTPMAEVLGSETRSWHLGANLFTVFGSLALVLAAIGLYSVISYTVAQRSHELGVRVALGAQVQDLVRLVLREGMMLSTVGVVLGTVIALVVARWVKPLLFQVSPRDPLVYGGVAAVLLLVAAVASLIPARRAGRVDPIEALRAE